MSFVRWGDDSDIYIYGGLEGLICQECTLMPTEAVPSQDYKGQEIPGKWGEIHLDFVTQTVDAMLEHIVQHREAGHKVPTYADEGLEASRAKGAE